MKRTTQDPAKSRGRPAPRKAADGWADMQLRNEIVTVFGGSGFLGRHTVRALAKAGWRIRVAVRRPNEAHFLRPMGSVGQIELVQANIRDAASVARALANADAVVDLVGILCASGKQTFDAIHAKGAETIAEAAKAEGITQAIFVSAIGADVLSPSRYGRTKADGEKAFRNTLPGSVILRPSIVFGPEDDFFNRFASLSRFAPALPLIGGGKTRFQPVYAGDVAAAIATILDAPGAFAGRTFELGGPNTYTFKDLLKLIGRITGRKRLLIPVPYLLAYLKAAFLGLLPNPLLTIDQVHLLKTDNVVDTSGEVGTFADLGITPIAPEAVLESYLWRFRKAGQFYEPAPE